MKVLVAGQNGQLARALSACAALYPGTTLVTIGRPAIELTDPDSIRRAVEAHAPDVVISAAAYTAVDAAESDVEMAHRVNATGAGFLATAAREAGAGIVHLSTDYVFSGDKWGFYTEWDDPDPVNVYGRTKLAGEEAVASANPHHVILRTAWLHSRYGHNFVRTMLRLAADHRTIRVVADQYGSPTAATDLAEAILHMLQVGIDGRYGTYHLAGRGATNWAGLARATFAISRSRGGPAVMVEDIAGSFYPTPATRPANSRLSSALFEHSFGFALPDWQEGLARTMIELDAQTSRYAPDAA